MSQIVSTGLGTLASTLSLYMALKGGPKAPKAPKPEDNAAAEAAAAQASAQAQAIALQRRRGAASTVLTGPLGLLGGDTTRRATLGA